MKSKISFFNKTIFWKNVSLYWPIWGLYTLCVFIYQPIIFWLGNAMSVRYDGYTQNQKFQDLLSCLYFEPYVIIIALASVLSGMALYSYLYNSKSANMIHSLPVDRTQLFGTALISGWTFLIVPLFASALTMTLLCICYGTPGIAHVWLFFFAVAALAVIAFSIVTICALFTGHIVVLPMYVFAVNYLSWIVYYLIQVVITTFGYGVQSLSATAESIAQLFSPLGFFFDNLNFREVYSVGDNNEIIDVIFNGWQFLILYLVIAVVLYIAAYVVYKTRKIESAGDFLTVKWIKPIFKGAVGIFGGIFSAMVLRAILLETRIGCNVVVFVVLMLLSGVIFYFIADMFIKKSFHVFKKRDWVSCGIFSVVLLVFFGGMYFFAEQYESYIPEQSEVKSASINMGYKIELEGDSVKLVIELHEKILENVDLIEAVIESGNRAHDSVSIQYVLESGEWVTRRYQLPVEVVELNEVYESILALESDTENYLRNEFGKNYDKVEVFYDGRVEAPFIEGEREQVELNYNFTYNSISLKPEQAEALYHAAIADAKAGTLMKYNIYTISYLTSDQAEVYTKSSDAYLSIDYKDPNAKENESYKGSATGIDDEVYEESYESTKGVYVNFGPDCENIINKLIEFEFIKSAEDIWWGEAEELLKFPIE